MINKITAAIMFLNVAALLVIGYLMFAPVQLAEIYNEPFPVIPQEVKRGETVSFVVEFNKTKQYRVTSHRSIICADGNLVTLSQTSSTNAPLGKHTATIELVIPDKVSIGSCYIQLENTYHINPMRDEHRDMRTQDFTVIE